MKITIARTSYSADGENAGKPLEINVGQAPERLKKTRDISETGGSAAKGVPERRNEYSHPGKNDPTFFYVEPGKDINPSHKNTTPLGSVDELVVKTDRGADITSVADGSTTKIIGHKGSTEPSTAIGNFQDSPDLSSDELLSSGLKSGIKSNVGEQDKEQDTSFSGMMSSMGNRVKNNLIGGYTDAVEDIKSIWSEDSVPGGNISRLEQWKSDHFKKIRLNDWRDRDTLNRSENMANSAMSDLRGELGKTTGGLATQASASTKGNSWATMGGQAADALLGGAGTWNSIAGIAGTFGANIENDSAWDATVDELASLNTVTKDTMYTSRPGIKFKAKEGVEQNITGSSSIFGRSGKKAVGDTYVTNYGQEIEQMRSSQKARDADDPYKSYAYNTDNSFSKKQSVYSLKKLASGSLANLSVSGDKYQWQKSADLFTGINLSDAELTQIAFLRNRNTYSKTLGSIYIRPYYDVEAEPSDNNLGLMNIPFEFTPSISESAAVASYSTEQLLGRLGSFNVFTGTSLQTLSVELQYIALAPDNLDAYDEKFFSRQYATDAWMYYWTSNRIEAVELKLRSLVLANYVHGDYIVKPPLVELHLTNEGSQADLIGDLYKYPAGVTGEGSTLTGSVDSKYLKYSAALHGGSGSRYKKYVVTSVQIDKISDADFDYPSLYGRLYSSEYSDNMNPAYHLATGGNRAYNPGSRRRGFRASLQLQEVTENFIDLVPDFHAYYEAWKAKDGMADNLTKYAEASLGLATAKGSGVGSLYADTADVLAAGAYTLAAQSSSITEQADALFREAELLAILYAKALNPLRGGEKAKIYNYNHPADDNDFYWKDETYSEPVAYSSKSDEVKLSIPYDFKVKIPDNYDPGSSENLPATVMKKGDYKEHLLGAGLKPVPAAAESLRPYKNYIAEIENTDTAWDAYTEYYPDGKEKKYGLLQADVVLSFLGDALSESWRLFETASEAEFTPDTSSYRIPRDEKHLTPEEYKAKCRDAYTGAGQALLLMKSTLAEVYSDSLKGSTDGECWFRLGDNALGSCDEQFPRESGVPIADTLRKLKKGKKTGKLKAQFHYNGETVEGIDNIIALAELQLKPTSDAEIEEKTSRKAEAYFSSIDPGESCHNAIKKVKLKNALSLLGLWSDCRIYALQAKTVSIGKLSVQDFKELPAKAKPSEIKEAVELFNSGARYSTYASKDGTEMQSSLSFSSQRTERRILSADDMLEGLISGYTDAKSALLALFDENKALIGEPDTSELKDYSYQSAYETLRGAFVDACLDFFGLSKDQNGRLVHNDEDRLFKIDRGSIVDKLKDYYSGIKSSMDDAVAKLQKWLLIADRMMAMPNINASFESLLNEKDAPDGSSYQDLGTNLSSVSYDAGYDISQNTNYYCYKCYSETAGRKAKTYTVEKLYFSKDKDGSLVRKDITPDASASGHGKIWQTYQRKASADGLLSKVSRASSAESLKNIEKLS